MTHALGIDLWTTFTAAAVARGGRIDAASSLAGGDLGGLLGAAEPALGGLGLGSLGSAVQGALGDCTGEGGRATVPPTRSPTPR